MIEEKRLIGLDDISIRCEMCGTHFTEGFRIQSRTFKNEPSYNLCASCYKNKRERIHKKINSILLGVK